MQWSELTQTRPRRMALMVVVLLMALAVISLWLPAKWRVERVMVIAAPPAVVFPYINSLKKWREWTVWHESKPELPTEYSGPETGVGATSRWTDGDSRGALKIMGSTKNSLVEYTLIFDGGDSVMHGSIRLVPVDGGGTRVVWRAGGDAGAISLQRYATPVFKYFIGRDFEGSLEKLRDVVEKNRPAVPAR